MSKFKVLFFSLLLGYQLTVHSTDVLGVSVIVSAANEMALVGSTMMALTAGGVYKDLNEASQKMLKGGKRIEPDKTATAVHDNRYLFFKKLEKVLGRCTENTLN